MTLLLSLLLAASVRVGVFGLFHPQALEVRPVGGQVLEVSSAEGTRVLEGATSGRVSAGTRVTGRGGSEATFELSVPGRIRRVFHGRLTVQKAAGSLTAVVEMDREVAVASIVAAEAPNAPFEAQKAQAVVTRSFLAASRARHGGFDFCDTTHCQFLRDPPPDNSLPARAAKSTSNLVITYEGRPIAALYSADCGGQTRTPADAGWKDEPYPYFSVECPVHGNPSGHRIGYCQRGGAKMAKHGSTFREILARYFPAVEISATERSR